MVPFIYYFLLAHVGAAQALSLQVWTRKFYHGLLELRAESQEGRIEIPVFNDLAKQHLSINIMVGTPPQQFSVMPDTASPFLWLPSATSPACTPNCPLPVWNPNGSSTAVDIHTVFNVSYGLTPDNIMLGEYYNDIISIGGVAVPQYPLALVEVIDTIYEAQTWGIMGLGSDLTNDQEGTILFGGIDESKAEGELKSAPLTFTEWSVNLTSLEPVISGTYNTILDTGSPNMYVPQALYDTIAEPLNVTLRTYRNTPYVPCSLRSSADSLHFEFAGKDRAERPEVRVPYSEIIYPFGMPANLGEVRSENGTELCYLGILSNGGAPIFLLGNTFIRSAYVVYDADALELRIAQSRWS
ncbi:acid protease [Bimuria novae-zelandiae CBS 107.79]|uniref:Acid protease n=1 Tax=Bimuria novae-zelandiae CBS 107.79 TaxID=1447943 RepID=A0A6A5V9I7_9PLEO|nr:acid protease [Bimuria novae-zelandiae CBS 107.79]